MPNSKRLWVLGGLVALWAVTAVAQQKVMSAVDQTRFTGYSEDMEETGLVTNRRSFDAASYTAWHSHDQGQLLFVETGRMRIQRRGERPREIGPTRPTIPARRHPLARRAAGRTAAAGRTDLRRRDALDGEGHAAAVTALAKAQGRGLQVFYVLCSSGRSSRTVFRSSSEKIVSTSRAAVAAPRTGSMRSRALSMTSFRVIGLRGVPRTASTRSDRAGAVGERDLDDRDANRQQSGRASRPSRAAPSPARAAPRRPACAALSCAALNEAVLSISITATMCCRQMSGMSRLSTTAATDRRQPHDDAASPRRPRTDAASRRVSMASSGAWIGVPTVHFLMSVRVISNRLAEAVDEQRRIGIAVRRRGRSCRRPRTRRRRRSSRAARAAPR